MRPFIRAGVAAGLTVLAMLAAAGSAAANPLFTQQTGQPCAACHQPGRELEGRNGLNPSGMAFMNCGESPKCFPVAQSGRRTTQTEAGLARFRHKGCHDQARYIVIMLGGTTRVGFVLERGNEVLVGVTRNSTFAGACGMFPGAGANQEFVALE